MNILQSFFLLASIAFGAMIALLVAFSNSEDQGILSNNQNPFVPGSFDSARNKIIAVFVAIFAFSILAINTIGVRTSKGRIHKIIEKSSEDKNVSKDKDLDQKDYE